MENFNIRADFSEVTPEAVLSEKPKEMLSVRRDGSQTLVRINSSSLSAILTCPRKAHYQLDQGWRSRSIAAPLEFGKAIHKALEVFYSHPRAEREIPANFKEVSETMAYGFPCDEEHLLYDAIRAFVKEMEPLRGLPDTDKRSIASGVWTLQHYFRTYINDQYVIHTDDKGPIAERGFELDLFDSKDLRIVLFGTIDVVFRDVVTNTILPGDHKTSSQLGADFFNRLKPNHQYTGYLLGANQVLGLTCSNFLVNGIQVKPKPVTNRGSPPTFTRQITQRSAQDIEDFRRTVVWAVRSYLQWREENYWPIGHVDACASYGACTYLEVCSQPEQLRENILDAKYVRERR